MKKLFYFLSVAVILSGAVFAATHKVPLERHDEKRIISYDLVLYYFPSCPYCQKVIRYLNKSGIALTMKDIRKNEIIMT